MIFLRYALLVRKPETNFFVLLDPVLDKALYSNMPFSFYLIPRIRSNPLNCSLSGTGADLLIFLADFTSLALRLLPPLVCDGLLDELYEVFINMGLKPNTQKTSALPLLSPKNLSVLLDVVVGLGRNKNQAWILNFVRWLANLTSMAGMKSGVAFTFSIQLR